MKKHCGDEGCMECERDALRAEVRDLKARLKAARKIHEHTVLREPFEEDLARVLDLRRKNWRKP